MRWSLLVAAPVAFIAQLLLGHWLGLGLHLFFAAFMLATLLASPLASLAERWSDRLLLPAAIVIGIAVAGLLPPARTVLTMSISLHCFAVLLAWTLAIVGLSRIASYLLREPSLGSAATIFAALLWLASPIWLGDHAAAVVPIHPLFAMNTVLIDLGFWTEQPIEYQYLFTLGQDVPYTLPASIWASAALHGLIGILALSLPLRRRVGPERDF